MSWDNRIIWSEGTFLQPQHFQQHDRHLETLLEQRTRALRPHGYGFLELAIDESLLELGKLAIASGNRARANLELQSAVALCEADNDAATAAEARGLLQ